MARNAILARMETICAEVMEMPEIFLNDDEEDENEAANELDEGAADAPVDGDDEEGEEDGNEDRGSKPSTSDRSTKSDKEKGVSVKVNCEDKKQQRYAKWISRALRAAVNPIVSRFNLSLKVNMDLNVANKASGSTTEKSDQEPSKPPNENTAVPTPEQKIRRADLARIRELEKENRHLEKVFSKIVSAYTDMKHNVMEKTTNLEKLDQELLNQQSRINKLCNENGTLQERLANHLSVQTKLELDISQMQDKITTAHEEITCLKREIENKHKRVQELEEKIINLQNEHNAEMNKQQTEFSDALRTKQDLLSLKDKEVARLTTQLEALNDSKNATEASFKQTIQDHTQKRSQMELKIMDLLQKNRELSLSSNRELSYGENTTALQPTSQSQGTHFNCPLCGTKFKNLEELHIHTETCIT